MTRPTPRPRHRAPEPEESAAPTPAAGMCKLGDGRPEYCRGLCRGHWDSRRGDADPKEA